MSNDRSVARESSLAKSALNESCVVLDRGICCLSYVQHRNIFCESFFPKGLVWIYYSSSQRNQIHPNKRMMKSVARHLRSAGNGILLGVAVNKTPRKEESSYERG